MLPKPTRNLAAALACTLALYLLANRVRFHPTTSESQDVFNAVQDHILRQLQPGGLRKIDITGTDDVATSGRDSKKGSFRMLGINYEILPPKSSRLQRLPTLQEFHHFNSTHGTRFANNPSLVKDPTRQEAYLLVTQLHSFQTTRHENGIVVYVDQHSWSHRHIMTSMKVKKSLGEYRIELDDSREVQDCSTFDLRFVNYHDALLAYPGMMWDGIVRLDVESTGATPDLQVQGRLIPQFDDHGFTNKNWQIGQGATGNVYYMSHFSPLTMLDCGTIPASRFLKQECHIYAFHNLSDSLLPKSSVHWRGSQPLIPIPGHPNYLLSTTHQRADPGEKSGIPFRDSYTHRFVMLEADTFMPVGFTAPFTLFAPPEEVFWFEFVTGGLFIGCDFVLTFAFNDQEPWLAILDFKKLLPYFAPVYPSHVYHLERLRTGFTC